MISLSHDHKTSKVKIEPSPLQPHCMVTNSVIAKNIKLCHNVMMIMRFKFDFLNTYLIGKYVGTCTCLPSYLHNVIKF
jgi:hypothetical protein